MWALPALTGLVTALSAFGYLHTAVILGATWVVALGLACVVADSPKITSKALRISTYSAVSLISAIGLGRLSGRLMAIVVVSAVFTHPGVVRPIWTYVRHLLVRFGWQHSAAESPPSGALSSLPNPAAISAGFRALTRTDLGLAWQAMHEELQQAHRRHQDFHRHRPLRRDCILCGHLLHDQVLIIDRRQRCLDEVERRSPAGFNRWLSGGADPASDPTRYLDDQPRRQS